MPPALAARVPIRALCAAAHPGLPYHACGDSLQRAARGRVHARRWRRAHRWRGRCPRGSAAATRPRPRTRPRPARPSRSRAARRGPAPWPPPPRPSSATRPAPTPAARTGGRRAIRSQSGGRGGVGGRARPRVCLWVSQGVAVQARAQCPSLELLTTGLTKRHPKQEKLRGQGAAQDPHQQAPDCSEPRASPVPVREQTTQARRPPTRARPAPLSQPGARRSGAGVPPGAPPAGTRTAPARPGGST